MDRLIAGKTMATNLLLHLFGDLKESMEVLAPHGWQASNYYQLVHPDVARLYQEALQQYENWRHFLGKNKLPPTLNEIQAEFRERPCYPSDELTSLLGECIWNIFSNNHTIIGPKGEVFDLGSFRGSARFIAELINRFYPSPRVTYDYLDFYCAGWLHHDRTDLTLVYKLLFSRLQKKQCTWSYTFPRTYLFNLGKEKQDQAVDPKNYDPARALQREMKKEKREQEMETFRQNLDDDYEQRKENAKFHPPPESVVAYHEVYGKWPEGWIF